MNALPAVRILTANQVGHQKHNGNGVYQWYTRNGVTYLWWVRTRGGA
jgi:hypothetical protein